MPADLSQAELLDLMASWADHARQVQELKDMLGYSNFFGTAGEHERLLEEIEHYDEAVAQIRAIYFEKMLPIMDRVYAFLAAHPEEVRAVQERLETAASG